MSPRWFPGDALTGDVDVLWGVSVLLQVSLVAALALIIARMLNRNPTFRHAVLCVALMLVLFSPLTALLLQQSGWSALAVSMGEPPAAATSHAIHERAPSAAPVARLPSPAAPREAVAPAIHPPREPPAASPRARTADPHASRWLGPLLRTAVPPLLCIWSAGAALLLLRLAILWFRLATIMRRARPLDAATQPVAAEAARALGITTPPRVVRSADVGGPLAAGILWPCVVLPLRIINDFSPHQLREILIHELAHLVRRDPAIALLQSLAAALFWLHPLVGRLNACLARAREEICDNYVLATSTAPSYTRTLLRLAELMRCRHALPASAGLLTARWKLETRAAGILDPERKTMTRLTQRGLVCVAVLSALLAAAAFTTTVAPAARGDDEPAASKGSGQRNGDQQAAADKRRIEPVAVPFRVTSRKFQAGDSVNVESFWQLPQQQGLPRYEVRGHYRLASRPRAQLAQWCSNGTLRANQGIEVERGEGKFRFTFAVVHNGNLHLSYYPAGGGNSFGSIYYERKRGKLRELAPPPERSLLDDLSRPAQQRPVRWQTDKSRYFRVHYAAGHGDDAQRVRGYLEQTVTNLCTEFGRERVTPLLASASIDVYLHPRPNDTAREGLALLRSGVQGDVYTARIDILAPSAHRPGATTSVGEPMDGNYIFKNLVHEYSTIVLDRITRSKPAGWRFFSAPTWFVQGYEEYLGLMLSSEHSRKVTFEKYRDLLRADPARVSPDLEVKSAYLDGAVLLQFLHETYGKQKVHGILASEADDFWSAVAEQTGQQRAALYRAWRQWLRGIQRD